MAKLFSANPAKNYEIIGSVDTSTLKDVQLKVDYARKARKSWKDLGVAKRIELIKPIFEEFMRRKDEISLLITREIGKPLRESKADIDWDQNYFRWFLENGEKYLSDEITFEDEKSVHKIVYEPIGVTAVIVPWNFPFGNFLWGVIPNLIAGNTVVFKHSEECPLTGDLIEKTINNHNLPVGVFSEVYGDGSVGEMLANENIDLIWFTGSTEVGKKLYEISGKKFIKAIQEMGGSNPTVIFDDSDIDSIIESIYAKRFSNCGQVCDALKRLIVHQSKFDEVTEKLKNVIQLMVVGDPENDKTNIGSLAAKKQLELIEAQVKDALEKGANVIVGGRRPENLKGAYYLPTILTNIRRDMRIWKEETFGPVLPIISFSTEEEAIMLANDTGYGLGAHIYSKDRARAYRVAFEIKAGAIDINQGNHWLPCNPFGGYKNSGMGREHGEVGFRELTQIKVISSDK